MLKVEKDDKAKEDLLAIHNYLAHQSQDREIADRFLLRVEGCLELLASQPHMGRQRDELRPGLRYHPFENYLIFYRPTDSGIEVARVLHSKRNVESIFH